MHTSTNTTLVNSTSLFYTVTNHVLTAYRYGELAREHTIPVPTLRIPVLPVLEERRHSSDSIRAYDAVPNLLGFFNARLVRVIDAFICLSVSMSPLICQHIILAQQDAMDANIKALYKWSLNRAMKFCF